MRVRIRRRRNVFSQQLQSYLELVAETVKEEKVLENIHFNFNLFTNLSLEGYRNSLRRKSKKVSLEILESRQPA